MKKLFLLPLVLSLMLVACNTGDTEQATKAKPEYKATAADYEKLLEDLKGLNQIESKVTIYQMRSGNELHIIPLKDGKPVNSEKLILSDCKIGATQKGLAFLGKNQNNNPCTIMFTYESENSLIVKNIIGLSNGKNEEFSVRGKITALM